MKYKLNLHAHTKYSDGKNTIKEMAAEYKKLGFSCAVISDHYYGEYGQYDHFSMNRKKFLEAKEDAKIASDELEFPVIIGMEYGFFKSEEVLCFGEEFIMKLYEGVKYLDDFLKLRDNHPSACVLCHPGLNEGPNGFIHFGGHNAIDGFEHYNSGQNMFRTAWRQVPKEFEGLTAFSNSDAHAARNLNRAYNLVDKDIKTEEELIAYIRMKRPVEPRAFGRNAEKVDENDPCIDLF